MKIRINKTLSYTNLYQKKKLYHTDENKWCKENAGKFFEAERYNMNYYKIKENGFFIHIYDALEIKNG